MNVITRGVRNAFRNSVRTLSIVIIIGLSIGLSLSMLVARQAVTAKITSVNDSVGTSISISPAGVRGFEGGGNPLTMTQLAAVSKLDHVTGLTEDLEDRLTSTDTNLTSSITAGSLGQRFAQSSGSSTGTTDSGGGGGGFGGFGGGAGGSATGGTFMLPVTVVSSTDPSGYFTSTAGGGSSFKVTSGSLFNANSTDDVAVVGSALATKNNLKVGSTFTAYTKTISVVGIYDAGSTFTNAELLMPLSTLQTLSSQVGDVTSATATADSLSNVTSVSAAITKSLGSSADVTNEVATAQSSVAPLENIKTITLYSLIGAVVAGAVIILLTMVMIVRERRREIGVLKAIGASNLKVMGQFMIEAITLTILGAVIGIVFGVLAANPITKLLVTNSTNSSSSTTSSQTPTGAGGFGGGTRTAGGATGGGFGGGGAAFRTQGRGIGGVRNGIANIHAVVGYSIIIDGLVAAIVIAILGSAAASLLIAKVRPAEVMRVD